MKELNELLPLIGVKWVDFEKMSRSQSYMRNKLDEITNGLAKILFEIPSPTYEDAAISLRSHGDAAEQEILQQLKDEFAKSTK